MDEQLVPLSSWGGIDESVDDSQCPPNRLRAAYNCIFTGAGIVDKRNGFTGIPTAIAAASGGGFVPRPRKLLSNRGELLLTDWLDLYSYGSTSHTHSKMGRVPACVGTRKEFTSASTIFGDVADSSGYRVTAWIVAGKGVFVNAEDLATGTLISSGLVLNTLADASSGVRCIALGTKILVVYSYPANIAVRSFDTATQTWSAATVLQNVAASVYSFDICPVVAGSTWILCFAESVNKIVKVESYNSVFAIQAGPTNVTAALPQVPLVTARATLSETCWVGYSYSNAGTCSVFMANHNPASLAQTSAPVLLTSSASSQPAWMGFERIDATHAVVVASIGNVGLSWWTVHAATIDATWGPFPNWLLMAKPFLGSTGKYYALAIYAGQYQSTQVLVELNVVAGSGSTVPLPMATIAPRASLAAIQGAVAIPGNINIARNGNMSIIGDATQTALSCVCFAISALGVTSLQLATFDFAHHGLGQFVQAGESMYAAAGVPFSYEGARPVEVGFLHAPPKLVLATSAAGAALFNKLYSYVAMYSQENSRGEIHRSPPNTYAPLSVDLTGGTAGMTNKATVTVNTYLTTFRQDAASNSNPVTIEIYRTHWDGASMSTVYYRVAKLANDLTVSTINFVDDGTNGIDETNIATQPPLYTTGSVLESDCPPSLRHICVHQGRLFGIGDEGKTIWYTTPIVQGEQPRWNDALKILVPDGGDLIALASKDSKLYAFKADRIFLIYGDGPSDTGAGADFSLPQRLPFDLGCVDARRICTMPQGIVFGSRRGLYLLNRADEMEWVGARVQRRMAFYPAISSIIHCETAGQVRISCRTDESLGAFGEVEVWDYMHDTWSTWIVTDAVGGAPLDAISVNGQYWTQQVASTVLYQTLFEDASTWLDAGTNWVTLVLRTPWVKASDQGIQRVHRLMVLGQRYSNHSLNVATYVNYQPYTADAYTISDAVINAIPVLPVEQLRISPATQKCESFSIELSDGAPTTSAVGTGQGVSIQHLMLKVLPKRGEFKALTAAQKA